MAIAHQAFQDLIPRNHCWGCGPDNPHGLHIKSYWEGGEAICRWRAQPWHVAGPTHVVNGGIIATLIDCHSVCSAIADAYRREGRPFDSEPLIWYATGRLDITYLKPAPIDAELILHAHVSEVKGKKAVIRCRLEAEGQECAQAEVVAIRVSAEWRGES